MLQQTTHSDAIYLNDLVLQVSHRGWLHMRPAAPLADIRKLTLEVACSLGALLGRGGEVVELLTPVSAVEAEKNSLSGQ